MTKKKFKHKNLSLQVFLISIIMLVFMTIYETLKQIISPDITIWNSHIITIIISTIIAAIASYFFLNKQNNLIEVITIENTKRKETEERLIKTIDDLKDANSKIKTLTGLLPICANCKKIRNDDGYWTHVEEYIAKNSDANFTHGICPDCSKKLYPEIQEKLKNKKKSK